MNVVSKGVQARACPAVLLPSGGWAFPCTKAFKHLTEAGSDILSFFEGTGAVLSRGGFGKL
jgi:hypothetical protein